MENFRMNVLRNLDLAIEIVIQEGSLILKKYDDLSFYLDNIAYGRIENFKEEQRVAKLEKEKNNRKKKRGKNGPNPMNLEDSRMSRATKSK